jgi:C1A family cysteine protease
MTNAPGLLGGYAIEQEDRAGLLATSSTAAFLANLSIPDLVDPRKHQLWANGFLRVEDQRNQGSCQGQALSENFEWCHGIQTGRVLQFSRQYAYIGSQIHDRISGDRGSTLSGGTKLALGGCCTEATGPYMNSYPGHGYITTAMRAEAEKYKLKSHTVIRSEEEVKQYIGSGLGIVQIGISWNNSMTPDANGCIRNFSAGGGGGHSVVLCGYVPGAEVGQRSTKGYWYLLKNSWGTRWGRSGFAYVDPSAVVAMLRHQWTVFVGRSDLQGDDLKPRPLPVDFTKPGGSMYA